MRPLASIYSHKVPGFMETQVGFNPNQKRNSNPKRKVQSRLSGRPTHATVDRPGRSHLPESRSSSVGRPGLVDRSNSRAGHFSRSIGAGRPLLPVHARARRSTGSTSGMLHAPFLAPLSSDLCATSFHLFYLLSPTTTSSAVFPTSMVAIIVSVVFTSSPRR